MDFDAIAKDTMTVKRAFGEPYRDNGLTVIPAAAVAGMAGGGSGHDINGEDGEGGGFGVSNRPLGAYEVKEGTIRWRPALDVNRLVAVAGAVLIVYIVSRARTSRARLLRAAEWPTSRTECQDHAVGARAQPSGCTTRPSEVAGRTEER